MNAFLLLCLLGQELTADQVVEKIDRAVSKIDDISLAFESDRVGTLFSPTRYLTETSIKIRRDGYALVETSLGDDWLISSAIRVKIAHSPGLFAARMIPYREDGHPELLPPAFIQARAKLDRSLTSDVFVMPNALPVRMFFDEPILHYQFAPKHYFGLEKNLRVIERRKVAGRDTYILGSRADVKDPVRAMAIPLVASATIEKFFYVDAETWLIERVIIRFDLGRNVYGGVIVSRVAERGERGIPKRTEYVVDTIERSRWITAHPRSRKIRVVGVNTGLKPADFEIPAVEVEGDAVLRPSKDAPADAAGRYNAAMSRLWVRRIAVKLLGQSSKEEPKAIEDLEKAFELAPKSELIAENLLAAYALYDSEKAIAFFEKAGFSSETWKEHGAALYVLKGRHDKAAPIATAPLRVDIALAKGDFEAALAAAAEVPELRVLSARFAPHWEKLTPFFLKDMKNPRLAVTILRCVPDPGVNLVKAALDQFPKDPGVLEEATRFALVSIRKEGIKSIVPRLPAGPDRDALEIVLLARDKKEVKIPESRRAAFLLAVELRSSHPEAAGRACAAYFKLSAAVAEDPFSYWDVNSTPFESAALLLKDGWSAGEFVRAFAPILDRPQDYILTWAIEATERCIGSDEDMAKRFEEHARKNPKDAEFAVLAARFLKAGGLSDARVGQFLDKVLETGEADLRVRVWRSYFVGGRESIPIFREAVKAGAITTDRLGHLRKAARVAAGAGDFEAAAEFLNHIDWKDVPHDIPILTDLARVALAAKAFARAREFAYALTDIGVQPFVLLGLVAEAEENYEEAVRWYNRDIKEVGDSYEPAEGAKAVKGTDAKKALLAKIGEDYFIKRLLDRKQEPLTKDEEKALEGHLDQLQSEGIDARDKAEESIRAFGPRAVPVLRKAMDATDPEVRERVLKILRDWAEPK